MKVDRKDSGPGKRILTAMIVSDGVCGRIAAHWGENMFPGKWENLVGGWCVRHFQKYEKAPGREIESIFARWSEDAKDENTVKLVESFLGTLSAEYETRGNESEDYVVDLAAQHFNRNKMLRFADAIRSDIDNGDDGKARERFNQFSHVELGVGAGVDVIHDKLALKQALADAGENLFEYDEGLKYFFDGMLGRDILLGFMAPMKRAKTFWQIDMAWRAMQQKRRVAFFEIGDMSQNQIMRRFAARAARRPYKATTNTGPIKWPTFLEVDERGRKASVTHKEYKYPEKLSYGTARAAMKKVMGELDTDETLLRLSVHANRTVNVPKIASILDSWERSRWVPDVVVIDYADLLAPISERERLHQIDENWAALRALSQQRHILVVTASQANAESFRAETMNETHFGGNKLIMAHAVGIVGLSRTNREKQDGISRVNWIQRREGEFDTEKVCFCAGCLAVANPAVKSIF